MLIYQSVLLGLWLMMAAMARRNHQDYLQPEPVRWSEEEAPQVSILIPARNEAQNIEACVRGLLAQQYPRLELVVLDDGSTDGTTEILERLEREDGRLTRVAGRPLPPGWGGKVHACHQAAAHARGEWLLFLDADTRHQPELVGTALRVALDRKADLLSTFPRQQIGSLGEALTVPLMYWVLFTLLPLRQAQYGPRPEMIAACGQCYLVRRQAYEAVGGHAAIPHSLHDGVHLARLFKSRGHAVRLADLSPLIRCRMYRGWRECWAGFTRNSFQGFGSLPVAVFVMLLEAVLFLGPFLSLAVALGTGGGTWMVLALGQVLLMLAVQVSLRNRFQYPWSTVLLFPAALLALLSIQACSAFRALSGHPTTWKDRTLTPPKPDTGSGLPGTPSRQGEA